MAQIHPRGKSKGFTLIETALATAIGILVVIGSAFTFSAIKRQQRFDNAMMIVQTIRTSLDAEFANTGSFPSLADLGTNIMTSGEKYYKINIGSMIGDCNNSGAIDAGTEHELPCDPYLNVSQIIAGGPPVAGPAQPGGWLYDQASGGFWINLADDQYVMPAVPSAW